MDCKAFYESIDAYLDGELEGAQRLAIERHLDECPKCRKEYEDLREVLIGAAQMGMADRAPDGFVQDVMARISQEKTKKPAKKSKYRWAKIAGSAAAGLVVLVLAGGMFLTGGIGMMGAASADKAASSAPMAYATTTANSASGSTMNYMSYDAGAMEEVMMESEMMDSVAYKAEDASAAAAEYERKIIVNGELHLQTSTFDEDLTQILAAVNQAGGYISSSSISGQPISETGSRYGRDAYYVVKIPAQQYDAVLNLSRGIGKVTYYNEYTDDITSDYYDIQTRLETYQAQYDKVTTLLEKCDNMEDILKIEAHLTELLYQIDSLKGQIRMWDQLVAFSTLSISLTEVADPSAIHTANPTLGERISEGFFGGINDLIEGGQDFLVWFVSNVFGLILWAGIFVGGFFIIRAIVRRRRK